MSCAENEVTPSTSSSGSVLDDTGESYGDNDEEEEARDDEDEEGRRGGVEKKYEEQAQRKKRDMGVSQNSGHQK